MTPLLPHRCCWPCCSTRERLFATAVGGPVALIMGGSGCPRLSRHCCSVVIFLPVVAVIVGVPVSSPGNAAPRLQPTHIARSGGWLLSPCPSTHDPTPLTVASSGRGGCVFIPLVLVVYPVSTPRQFGMLSWCQLNPAVCRPVVHPASRGSQQWRGRRG